jgi:hypothetical protein
MTIIGKFQPLIDILYFLPAPSENTTIRVGKRVDTKHQMLNGTVQMQKLTRPPLSQRYTTYGVKNFRDHRAD